MMLLGLVGIALVVLGPWVFGTYLLNILIKAFFFAIVAITVDLLWGYTGYLTFGQSAFFGIGAYAAGLVFTHAGFTMLSALAALGLAVAGTALVGALVAWIGTGAAIGLGALGAGLVALTFSRLRARRAGPGGVGPRA